MVSGRPTGIVTFLFTDVEGSTRLWEADKDGMSFCGVEHDGLVRRAVEEHGGLVFATAGDSFAVAFSRASDAVRAAATLEDRLRAASWPGPALSVRMGLHLGEAEERDGDYFGPAVNIAARVEAAAHGSQVLLTEPVRAVAGPFIAVDLGVHQLRDVAEAVRLFQLGDEAFPAPRTERVTPSNLPVRPTRLIGRLEDLARCRELLQVTRLVTIAGIGGAGKTRLAISVGEAELACRRGGVWFTDLTAVMRGGDVPEAVAQAVGLSLRHGDATEQVIAYLANQGALVILDNCEHVVDACAAFADRFLATAGDSVLLATSREALEVDGERLVALGALPAAGERSPAVELFMDRTTAVDPGFELTADTLLMVEAVCERLDGLPLAIELAAARVNVLNPAELLNALDRRFELLTGGRRQSGRHRTLEATLDWSFDLLGPHEQAVLRSLGVFVDGFDLDAVGAVAGISPMEALNVVDALAARSLLVRTPTGRFRLLETVKAYAERRLSASGAEAARDAHLAYFHRLAVTFGRTIGGELRLGRRLRLDRANLTAAFEYAAGRGQWTLAAELLIGGHLAYETGSALEVRALVDRAVDHLLGVDDDVVPFLWCVLLFICTWLSDWPSFVAVAHAMANSNYPPARAFGSLALSSASSSADVIRSAAHLERAEAELRAAQDIAPGLNSSMLVGWVHYVRAAIAAYAGDYDLSLAHAQACDAAEAATDYRTVNGLWATQLGAACLLVLDQPAQALHTVAPLEQYELTFYNGDEVRALACLELGRVEEAETLIRDYAQRAATGRIASQASDGALLLAALCRAEGELEYAAELLLRMGVGSQPATIMYGSWLAARLGIAQTRAERLASALRYNVDSEQGPTGTVTAREAVGNELARRGWAAR